MDQFVFLNDEDRYGAALYSIPINRQNNLHSIHVPHESGHRVTAILSNLSHKSSQQNRNLCLLRGYILFSFHLSNLVCKNLHPVLKFSTEGKRRQGKGMGGECLLHEWPVDDHIADSYLPVGVGIFRIHLQLHCVGVAKGSYLQGSVLAGCFHEVCLNAGVANGEQQSITRGDGLWKGEDIACWLVQECGMQVHLPREEGLRGISWYALNEEEAKGSQQGLKQYDFHTGIYYRCNSARKIISMLMNDKKGNGADPVDQWVGWGGPFCNFIKDQQFLQQCAMSFLPCISYYYFNIYLLSHHLPTMQGSIRLSQLSSIFINTISILQHQSNKLKHMNFDQEIQNLERRLHTLQAENTALRKQNDQQRAEVGRLMGRIDQLERVAANQPIQLIMQHLDPIALDSTLHVLQSQISSQSFQLSCLQRAASDSHLFMTEAQRRAVQLEKQLHDRQLHVDNLFYELGQANIRETQVRQQADTWRTLLEKSNQNSYRIVAENQELKRQLSCEKTKNHMMLVDLAKQVASLRQSTTIQTSPHKDSGDFESLSALCRAQQMELQERNQEIARLKSMSGNFNDGGQQHLKNTIKHLRGQMSRYSDLVQHITGRMAVAEDTINKYSASAEQCNKERASCEKLNEQIIRLNDIIRGLEGQLRAKTKEYEKQREAYRSNTLSLVEALKENELFHQFLFEQYGQNSQEIIDNERKNFQDRLMMRRQRQKWASVKELIEVNEQLRARLKI